MTSKVGDSIGVFGKGYRGVESDAKKLGEGNRADGLAV